MRLNLMKDTTVKTLSVDVQNTSNRGNKYLSLQVVVYLWVK